MLTLEELEKGESKDNPKTLLCKYSDGKLTNPVIKFSLTLDDPNVPAESMYFWILEFLRHSIYYKVEKFSDVFGASPGSSFLGEMGQRMAILLDRGRQMCELINAVVRSILSIVYELKWIKERLKIYEKTYWDKEILILKPYEEYKKLRDKYNQILRKTERTKEEEEFKNKFEECLANILSLKSVWLDRVDVQKGAGSLLSISRTFRAPAIVDIFMSVNYPEEVFEMVKEGKINERVARVVASRLVEFRQWLKEAEKELKTRYKLLLAYLKHQVNALMTYFEFARPYLRFARKLLMKEYNTADVVSIFETAILELAIFAVVDRPEINLRGFAEVEVPEWDEYKKKWKKEKFLSCLEVKFKFRLYPVGHRISASSVYVHVGRCDFEVYGYVLTEKEIEELRRSEEEKDLLYIEGMTKESLEAMAQPIFEAFITDYLEKDPELKKKLEELGWTQEFYDFAYKKYKKVLEGIEWIKSYLPKAEKREEKKEETKYEEKEVFVPFIGKVKIKVPKKEKKPLYLPPFSDLFEFFKFLKPEIKIEKKKGPDPKEIKLVKEKYTAKVNTVVEYAKFHAWLTYKLFKRAFGCLVY